MYTMPASVMNVRDAVRGRKSVRGFKPDAIPEDVVRTILDEAARAPSGTNTQPWLVHVALGKARDRLVAELTAAASHTAQVHEYLYSPAQLPEPYLSRRRKVGFDLYGLAGIGRNDMEGRKRQSLKNYGLFGAPVALFFCMDRRLELGSWLDLGMFMQNVMVLARGFGLETCPQAAWCYYGPAVHKAMGIPDEQMIVSGMAMGIADWDVTENALVTERAPASEFARFVTD